ncbi:Putative Glucoamylase A (Fragment) [Rhizopus microsporus]
MFSASVSLCVALGLFIYFHIQKSSVNEAWDKRVNDSFDDWISKQRHISFQGILNNINPPGTPAGFLAASLSTYHPDYYYTWTRDAALVARVLSHLPETEDNLLIDYVNFQIHTQGTPTVCNCLGEPKFNPDGSGFSGSWGRPQNDGPAERAITFMRIADRFKGRHDSYINHTIVPALEKDLDYIVRTWEQSCFDLWEEVNGIHFYTLMAIRRALLDGANFLGVNEYQTAAAKVQKRLDVSFWSSKKNYIQVTHDARSGVSKPSGLDVSVLLAANMFSTDDGFFTPGSDKILATAAAIEAAFLHEYPINQNLSPDLGTAIGRYPEDVYDGYGLSIANPWFLATAAYAELYYLATNEWKKTGLTINQINKPFFQRLVHFNEGFYSAHSDELEQIIANVSSEADKFLATIQYHQHRNGSMSEQFSRYNGYMQGARDLTWSHAAFISAIQARESDPIL